MKLPTPQQQLILDYLRDLDWHCMATKDFFMKDDRKRCSELNEEGSYLHQKGYWINSRKCDGRCGINHSSRIFMRRAERLPVMKPAEYDDAFIKQLTLS